MLLDKFCAIEGLLKTEKLGAAKLIKEISEIIGIDCYLVNSEGDVLAMAATGSEPGATRKPVTLKAEFRQRLSFIFETAANLPIDSAFLNEDQPIPTHAYMTLIPIRNVRATSGHLIVTKSGLFTDDELILAKAAALVACIHLYEQDLAGTNENHEKSNALLVLDSLSFSELKAISNVLTDLNGSEGFLVASKVADRIGISRSVIVNAMRKLESAGVVESRSLGIKGTYIKVKNQHFVEALFERVS